MDIRKEIEKRDELIGMLTQAYTLLALAPYDHWGHEGTPAQMAAYVVRQAERDGRAGFLYDVFFDRRGLQGVG